MHELKKSQHEWHSKHVGSARGLKRGDAGEVAVGWKSETEGSQGVPGPRCHVLPVPWSPRDSCTAPRGTEVIPGSSLVLFPSLSSHRLSQVRSLTHLWGCFGNKVLQTLFITLLQPKQALLSFIY